MKSDHRHELKTNELAQWVAEFPQWAQENKRTIITGCAIVVAVVLIYAWFLYDKNVLAVNRRVKLSELTSQLYANKRQAARNAAEGKDLSSLVLLESGNRLAQFAESTGDATMAALAYLKRAEAVRSELHYRLGQVSSEEIAKQIEQAKANYRLALDKAGSQVSLQAAAQYGLGLCAEELSDQAQARQIYQQIVSDPALKGTVAQGAAQYRLDTLADYADPVVFRPTPEPALVPGAVAPDLSALPVDANKPASTPVQAVAPASTSAVEPNTAGPNTVAP
jgi:hypothetical protein